MRKRILTAILALVLSVSCFGLTWAFSEERKSNPPDILVDPETTEAPSPEPDSPQKPLTKLEQAELCADQLHDLGLFQGTNQGYDLESTATRAQAVTMLLRLMGLEVYAQARPTVHPFTDLPRWCTNAVAYAYNSGLANGVTPTTFAPNDTIGTRAYLTFLLRALGYGQADGLTWKGTYDFAGAVGLLEPGTYTDDSEFLRADLVLLSCRALKQCPKGSSLPLLEQLQSRPHFTVLDNGFVNTACISDGYRGGSGTFAGQLADLPASLVRPIWNGTETADQIMTELNTLSPCYEGLSFSAAGITEPGKSQGEILRFVTDSNGRVGVIISNWRQGYASSTRLNQKLNLALEALLYLSGDGETAYALWSWLDATNTVEGGADTTAFGFRDVEPTAHGGFIEMNQIRIEVDLSDPRSDTLWFTPPVQPEHDSAHTPEPQTTALPSGSL